MTVDQLRRKLARLGLAVDEASGEVLVEWEKIPFSEKDRPYWALLSSVDGIGPKRLPALVAACGSAKAVLELSVADLVSMGVSPVASRRVARLGSAQAGNWFVRSLQPETDLELKFMVPQDKLYPENLRQIDGAPSQLWVWGDAKILTVRGIIAVVGTRRVTAYGREVTESLSRDLAQEQCVIISGLMYGVDEIAMRAAMAAGGKTIGVWAGGISRANLSGRFALAAEVVKAGGVIVSEYAPAVTVYRGSFPARNRIVAGIASAVIVTQAAEKSGSLITAGAALSQGRPVGAVPGPITVGVSTGSNELLKLGALAVTGGSDVLQLAGLTSVVEDRKRQRQYQPASRAEEIILSQLRQSPQPMDNLSRAAAIPIGQLSVILTELEVKGVIHQVGDEWACY